MKREFNMTLTVSCMFSRSLLVIKMDLEVHHQIGEHLAEFVK